jgi:hypothetical protein
MAAIWRRTHSVETLVAAQRLADRFVRDAELGGKLAQRRRFGPPENCSFVVFREPSRSLPGIRHAARPADLPALRRLPDQNDAGARDACVAPKPVASAISTLTLAGPQSGGLCSRVMPSAPFPPLTRLRVSQQSVQFTGDANDRSHWLTGPSWYKRGRIAHHGLVALTPDRRHREGRLSAS